MKIKIRPAVSSDHNFIYATYLRNEWFNKSNATTLKRATWSALHHKKLEEILKGLVLIACLDESPDTILGYSFSNGSKPYCYVKLAWRSEGLIVKDRLLEELSKHENQD